MTSTDSTTTDGGGVAPSEIETRVVKKVARRLIPFLILLYFVNYLDRTNIAFAKLTMSADLGMTETMFGLASGLFFVGYLLFEVPSNLALHRFGARLWIARIMLTWGILAAALAFVPNVGSLYFLRILLGIAEAGFFPPGVLLYLTFWFPKKYRVRLMGLFLLTLPLSSALGAPPLSAAIIQYGDGLFGLAGWRVMYLIEGLPAVILAFVVWFYLTDRPADAKWLTLEERTWLMKSMADEEKELGDAGHQSAGKTLRDPRVIGFGLVYFGITYGLYALSFFLPSIVAGFKQTFDTDFSLVETGLIVAVPYAIGAVAMVLWSRHSDKTGERMWHVAAPDAPGRGIHSDCAVSGFTVHRHDRGLAHRRRRALCAARLLVPAHHVPDGCQRGRGHRHDQLDRQCVGLRCSVHHRLAHRCDRKCQGRTVGGGRRDALCRNPCGGAGKAIEQAAQI